MISRITPNFTPRVQTQNNQPSYMAKANYKANNVAFTSIAQVNEYPLSYKAIGMLRYALTYMKQKGANLTGCLTQEGEASIARLFTEEGIGKQINGMVFQDGTSVPSITSEGIEIAQNFPTITLTSLGEEKVVGIPVGRLRLQQGSDVLGIRFRHNKGDVTQILEGSVSTKLDKNDEDANHRVIDAVFNLLNDLKYTFPCFE